MDRQASLYEPYSLLGSMSSPSGGGVGSGQRLQSPYLQFDPSLVGPQTGGAVGDSEFIFPDGASRHSRGRFELAFSQIGSSVMTGAALGGAVGSLKGLRSVAAVEQSLAVKRSQLLNYITKNGASTANTFGTIALIYSAIGVGLSFVQDRNDDVNTIVSAVATGALYGGLSSLPDNQRNQRAVARAGGKLWPVKLRRSAFGACLGLAAAATYVLVMNKDKYLKK